MNVGAGDKYFPGFVNCDLHGEQDIVCDISKIPVETDHADELHAYHVLEHIHRKTACETLQEWFRVLKRGGKIVIEVPCLNKIAQHIVNGEKNQRLTVLGLFGDPRDTKPDMMHQWCYTKEELVELMVGIGFSDVNVEEPVFHIASRDMRVTGVKP